MTDRSAKNGGFTAKSKAAAERKARLAAQLRANLKKRKERQRAGKPTEPKESDSQAGG